jgi:hypothetical protein
VDEITAYLVIEEFKRGKTMDKNAALFTAGVVFGLVAIFHVIRVITNFGLKIGSKDIPRWANVIGFIIAGFLCAWMFSATRT